VARDGGELQVERFPEVAFHHLIVGTAHSGRIDAKESLIGCDGRLGNFLKYQWLIVTMHSRCAHVSLAPYVWMSFPTVAEKRKAHITQLGGVLKAATS
jgi:hypothetical protein